MAHKLRSVRSFFAFLLNGGPDTTGLPARVVDEIDRREDAAERLIGWVQLAFLVAFAALYAVAPRAEGGSGENFVPITLAIYFGFTVFRLALSYRMTLPGWFLVLSILIDTALLCGLIFSFHIQYNQPAAFYLKAPTMIYLFIFISLRALRFDPRFVLTAGLTAALGWLCMVAFALMSDMGTMHITRNYVEYLTSNSILIGAEIDKTVTLLGVTLILTLALYRARRVLFAAVQSANAAQDLSRFFAPEVAASITSADDGPGGHHTESREAAILFVDVRCFTSMAEALAAPVVMASLALYQQIAVTQVERFGGSVDKFIGDGILATFGAMADSQTYAADALHAARAVIGALDAAEAQFAGLGWPGTFRGGASVAAGMVTVGVIGTKGRAEFTVIGNAVNLAAKLETANKVEGTRALTDAATLRTAQGQGFAEHLAPRPNRPVEGLTHPVDLAVLA